MRLLPSIATVGGFTMLSRVLGFVRDILIAAIEDPRAAVAAESGGSDVPPRSVL